MSLFGSLANRIQDHRSSKVLKPGLPSHTGPVSVAAENPLPTILGIWSRPDVEFVRGTYQAVCGIEPDETTLADRLRVLQSGTPRAELVRQIATGHDCDPNWLAGLDALSPKGIWARILAVWTRPAEEFIGGLYEILFRRPADPNGMVAYLGLIADGKSRVEVVRHFASSVEFGLSGTDSSWLPRLCLLTLDGLRDQITLALGQGDEGFLRSVYDAILHREPTDQETGMHLGGLGRGGTRAGVVRTLLASPESGVRYVGEEWMTALADLLDPPEPKQAEKADRPPLAPGELRTRLAELVGGEDEPFVRGLYDSVLHREPAEDELRAYLGELGRGIPRAGVIRDFLASPEAGGRYAGAEWAAALADVLAAVEVSRPVMAPDELRDRLVELLPLPSEMFVRGVYDAVLRRDPTQDELGTYLSALCSEITRQGLIREFLVSPEAGGRYAGAEWAAALADVISAPGTKPERRDPKPTPSDDPTPGSRKEKAPAHASDQTSLDQQPAPEEITAASQQLDSVPLCTRQTLQDVVIGSWDAPTFRSGAVRGRVRVAAQEWHPIPSTVFPGQTPETCDLCRVCCGVLAKKWSTPLPGREYRVDYYECESCQALQVVDPSQLGSAPAAGRCHNPLTAFSHLRVLADAGLPIGRTLQCGGDGELARSLGNAGVDAWTYAVHTAPAPDRVLTRLESAQESQFDAIVVLDGFERLNNPSVFGSDLSRLLRPGGVLVIVTETYNPGGHGPKWEAALPEAGGVLFWSRESLRMFAVRLGFSSAGYVVTARFPLVILADRAPDDLANILTGGVGQLAECVNGAGGVDHRLVLGELVGDAATIEVIPMEQLPGGLPSAA